MREKRNLSTCALFVLKRRKKEGFWFVCCVCGHHNVGTLSPHALYLPKDGREASENVDKVFLSSFAAHLSETFYCFFQDAALLKKQKGNGWLGQKEFTFK